MQPQDCATVANRKVDHLDRGVLQIRNWQHAWGTRTLIMGIVNVTPDSFSGDGIMDSGAALKTATAHLSQGADIIDVGGESTRPGHESVSEAEELRRVIPVIQRLRKDCPNAVISIDTTKADVLRQAIDAGADILNSIWGLTDALAAIVFDRKLPVVLMHNKEAPIYGKGGAIEDVLSFLSTQAQRAQEAGIRREQIILDPGIGFGKLAEHNLEVLRQLRRIVNLGFPTLLGASRKSFLGKITGQPVENRVFGSAATVSLAIASGIDIVRVHDVAAMKDVVQVSDAIVRCPPKEMGSRS